MKTKINPKLLFVFLVVLMLVVSLPFAGLTAFAASIRYGDNFDYFMQENGNISIRYLGDEASVIVPSEIDGYTVSELGREAFIYKENLTDITIPDSITYIDSYAFIGSDNLKEIYYAGSEKQWKEATAYFEADTLKNITVHYNYDGPLFTSMISDMMTNGIFNYRYSLEDSTAEIYKCNVYEPEEDDTDVTVPSELDGHTVTAVGSWSFYNSAVKSVTIPDTVISIGDDAFAICFYLENITIPGSVTSIGENAFESCIALKDITIPKGVTGIEYGAFLACGNLASITLSNGVTSVGKSAFYGCDSLTDVYFNGTEEQWNVIAIEENNEPLINATIHFNPVEEPTDQTSNGTATDINNPSSSTPAIDLVIIILIAVAVIIVAIVVTAIVKKRKK